MSLFSIVTSVVGLGADFGISSLIGNIATTVTTKTGNKLVDKICIGIGTAVVAGMAGEAAQKYIERKANEIKDAVTPEYMKLDEFDDDFDDDIFIEEEEVDADE